MSDVPFPESAPPQQEEIDGLTLHRFPRPISAPVLGVAKKIIGFGAVLLIISLFLPSVEGITGLISQLFTVMLISSWVGPGLNFLRRPEQRRRKPPQ